MSHVSTHKKTNKKDEEDERFYVKKNVFVKEARKGFAFEVSCSKGCERADEGDSKEKAGNFHFNN